ncbi:Haloalkane dehalogenase [subsurface metagenome]
MASIQPSEGKVRVNDINMHYVEWAGEGSAVLCVHGLTANCREWDRLGEGLSPRHRVLAIDLRGRGDSDKPATGYGLAGHAADLEGFLNALNLEQVVLVGHSLGAMIGVYFAANFQSRVSKLVLVDGGNELADMKEVLESIRVSLSRLDASFPSLDDYMNLAKQAPFLQGDWNEYMERYVAFDMQTEADGSVRSKVPRQVIEADISPTLGVRLRPLYSRIVCPTLILRASHGIMSETDFIMPQEAAAAMQQAIANCKVLTIDGTNHYTIVIGKRNDFVERVRGFLEG